MKAVQTRSLSASVLAEMERSVLSHYDLAPVGFLCLSLDGWICKVNRTLLNWLGYSNGDMVARKRFHDLVSTGARIFFDTQHMALLLTQGQVQDIAVDLIARDGSVVPVLLNTVLERDAQGTPVWMQMSLFNASERRRYERELLAAKRQAERAAITLDERVTERTSQLSAALIRAEKAVRVKDEFLANMSHEIRTPLNCILGMTQLLRDSVHTQPQVDYLDTILRAGNNVVRIVSEILDFCKINAGKLEIEHVPINLRDIVFDVAARFAGQARDRDLTLKVEVDEALPQQLMGDTLRLSQILSNYLDNAIKFTERGQVRVRTLCFGPCDKGMRVRVEVHDTGIGLSPEQQLILFQPFQQVDSSTTRKYGGTGLGLAICRQLAELMDGSVGVTSSDIGSVFWFEVVLGVTAQLPGPVATNLSRMQAQETDESPRGESQIHMRRLSGTNILLAEDNPLNQELMRIMLERVGARITIAEDGAQALIALADTRYDCVLMDVQMPVMDGFETTRRIRADVRLRELPIIALTANAFDSSRADCLAAGMDDFLTKPIDTAMFYRTLALRIQREGDNTEQQQVPALAPLPEESPEDISLSLLASLVDDDPAVMADLLAIFFANADTTVGALADALAANDLVKVAALGHRLKSAARAVGAIPLADMCLALETAASISEAARIHAEFPAALARLQQRLKPTSLSHTATSFAVAITDH